MATPTAGDLDGVGIAVEATSGTYLAPTNYIDVESNSVDPKVDQWKKNLMTATRFAARTKRPGKWQVEGAIAFPLGGNHGAKILRPAFGVITGMTALTADTVKTATTVTTSNGISTITLTNTGSATYVQGAWVQVNTSTSAELRQILTITGNGAPSTSITVGALVGNATAAAGTAVTQIAQLKFTTGTTSTTLPTLSLSLEEAGLYEWQIAGTYIDKYGLKLDKDFATVTANVYGTTKPVRSTVRTPTLTASETTDVTAPLSVLDSMLIVNQDPVQAGGTTATAAQQLPLYINSWSLEWSNGLIKKPFHDLTQTYKAFPGTQSASVSYTYATAGRPSELEDYIGSLAGQSVPMAVGLARNTAASGAAVWSAVGVYMPSVVLEDHGTKRSIGDVHELTIKGEPVPATATGDALTVYVCNNDGSTTTGY